MYAESDRPTPAHSLKLGSARIKWLTVDIVCAAKWGSERHNCMPIRSRFFLLVDVEGHITTMLSRAEFSSGRPKMQHRCARKASIYKHAPNKAWLHKCQPVRGIQFQPSHPENILVAMHDACEELTRC